MNVRRTLTTVSCLALLSAAGTQAALVDLGTGATAGQSSQLGGFAATNATDAVVNFTHTLNSDTDPRWQVLLPDSYNFNIIEAFNREASDGTTGCCPSRLRDITIQVVQFSGDPTTDFTGGTVNFSSALLNPENIDSPGGTGTTTGVVSVSADAGGAAGNLIRVIRTIDDDLSGTGGVGNADEGRVLSLDLVTADGTLVPEPGTALLGLLGLGLVALRRRRA